MNTIKKWVSSGVLGLSLVTGCSTMERGQLSDVGTTFIGFQRGFIEKNPIMRGLDIREMLVVKLVIASSLKLFVPEPVCTPMAWSVGTVGYGAAAWNIGVMAGSGPAGVGLFAIAAYFLKDNWWNSAKYTCSHRLDVVPVEIDFGLNSAWFNDKF